MAAMAVYLQVNPPGAVSRPRTISRGQPWKGVGNLPSPALEAPTALVGLLAATVIGGTRRARRGQRRHQLGDRRAASACRATAVEDPEVEGASTDEEDEDPEFLELQAREKMELERVLPEDKLRENWVIPEPIRRGPRTIRPKSLKRVEWDNEDYERDFGHNPWSSFALAPAAEKEAIAKTWTHSAREAARKRLVEGHDKHHVGDDVGTGPSHSAYVEIRERWDGPEEEAVNIIVAEHLGIEPKRASWLVELGAVWYYEAFELKEWVRIMAPQKISSDCVLRVFPNPERYKTAYMDDWNDRIKKVDRDFVVVDKPPLLPCSPHVTNGRETLIRALADGLRVKTTKEVELGLDDLNMTPMTHIDDEVSGLVVLARHEKARIVCTDWVENQKFTFEFVAICTGTVEKGHYRHFYLKKQSKDGQLPRPTLYDEIPPEAIHVRADYDDWHVVTMEVVACAELDGGYAALRIRTNETGPFQERIRTQLAMLGAPVLNDKAATRFVNLNQEVAKAAGLLPQPRSKQSRQPLSIVPGQGHSEVTTAVAAAAPMGGAVDEEVLQGPYGYKLQLLPGAKMAASRGIPQTPMEKVPVALHLARMEFMGRVITCAPPPYWPEGAAAAVATRLTTKDIKSNIMDFLVLQGGWSTIRVIGGKFGVKVDWLEKHFPVLRSKSRIFASESAMKEWEAEERVKRGKKSWGLGIRTRREKHKKKMWQLRERFLPPEQWGKRKLPWFKEIKRGLAKPVDDYLGRTNL
ncbi:unnamed protein product [Effrenium voratum]|nr:unnamed protein product [Effrenium voratum]